jgi:hypothetical protein
MKQPTTAAEWAEWGYAARVVEYLESGGALSEDLRARVHAATGKVRMTDRDLKELVNAEGLVRMTIFAYLQDLRDRYEEIGPYAPAAPEAGKEQQYEHQGSHPAD